MPRLVIGSSPLARGLQQRGPLVEEDGGIIPARAGFTDRLRRTHRAHRDHPRSRGVYLTNLQILQEVSGSSPLARGLPSAGWDLTTGTGIIPARAGFTAAVAGHGPAPTDHPRSRGVYYRVALPQPPGYGSSPLARGLPVQKPLIAGPRGIIPARAGFTTGNRPAPPGPADHPRSRGVYSGSRPSRTHNGGSSPLARGLRWARGGRGPVRRIIPARAGFTAPSGSRTMRSSDHPRSRGVYCSQSTPTARRTGSSPLARGLLGGDFGGGGAAGIIPARAGFTP